MIAAVREQSRSPQWKDPQFIPHPRTWLSQGRWTDEPDRRHGERRRLWTVEDCAHGEPKCGTEWRCDQRTELAKAKSA
jgi:hypothetical protein